RGHRALAHRVGAKGAGAHRRAPRHPRASPVTTARCRVPPSWVPWPMPTVLAVNAGSSSLKFAPLPPGDPPVRRSAGSIDRIGQPAATLTVDGGERGDVTAPDHAAALPMLVDALEARGITADAIGHRLVHGGPRGFPATRGGGGLPGGGG